MFDTLIESRPHPLSLPRWGIGVALGLHVAALGAVLRPRVPGIPETPVLLVVDLPPPPPLPVTGPAGNPGSLVVPPPIDPLPPLPTPQPITGGAIADVSVASGRPEGGMVYPGWTSGSDPVPDALLQERPELLVAPQPVYPARLRDAGAEGTVVVQVIVDTSGRAEPGSARIVQHADRGFEISAMAAIRRAQFRPARVWGRAVRALVQVPVAFRIRR